MPYIKQENRENIDEEIKVLVRKLMDEGKYDKGTLNYIITTLMHYYIALNGLKYSNVNDVVGILECAKLEFYRKIAGPYEDIKIDENGDLNVIEVPNKGVRDEN